MSNAKTSLEEHYPSLLSDAPLHLLKYLKLISGTIVSPSIWLQSCPNTAQSAADQPEKKNHLDLSSIFHSVSSNQWIYVQTKGHTGTERKAGPAFDSVWGTVDLLDIASKLVHLQVPFEDKSAGHQDKISHVDELFLCILWRPSKPSIVLCSWWLVIQRMRHVISSYDLS